MWKLLDCLIFAICIATLNATDVDYCEIEETQCKGLKHVGCIKEQVESKCEQIEMTDERKEFMLNVHNEARMKLASGELEGLETAAKLFELVWDPELAYLADINARSCRIHSDECRVAQNHADYGQYNMITEYSTNTFEEMFNSTFHRVFAQHVNATMKNIYDSNDTNSTAPTSFFRRIVSDRTFTIGCGGSTMGRSSDDLKFYVAVCNFNFRRNEPVYVAGDPCSLCQNGCSEKYPGLCKKLDKPESATNGTDTGAPEAQIEVPEIPINTEALASVPTTPAGLGIPPAIELPATTDVNLFAHQRVGEIGLKNNFMWFGSNITVNVHNYN